MDSKSLGINAKGLTPPPTLNLGILGIQLVLQRRLNQLKRLRRNWDRYCEFRSQILSRRTEKAFNIGGKYGVWDEPLIEDADTSDEWATDDDWIDADEEEHYEDDIEFI